VALDMLTLKLNYSRLYTLQFPSTEEHLAYPLIIFSDLQHFGFVTFCTCPNMASEQDLKEAHKKLFDDGLQTRYSVAGKEYVDRALSNGSSDFSRPMQE
jgi:hypothetical protein